MALIVFTGSLFPELTNVAVLPSPSDTKSFKTCIGSEKNKAVLQKGNDMLTIHI